MLFYLFSLLFSHLGYYFNKLLLATVGGVISIDQVKYYKNVFHGRSVVVSSCYGEVCPVVSYNFICSLFQQRPRSMTTSVVCGVGIKSKPRLYRGAEPCRMDPQFMQLESQLAALRNQRYPTSTTKLTVDVLTPTVPANLPPSPAASSQRDAARKSDTHGMARSSSSSSSALSQDTPVQRAETSICTPSSSSSSSSSSVDSATTAEKHDVRDSLSDNDVTTESAASSEQRQSNSVTSYSSSAARQRSRSVPSIREERSRFRIVKIDSYVDRGRWHCHNFADPPMHDADISSSAQLDSGRGAVGCGDDTGPSQIYYIAAGHDDRDMSDPSKKLYVSTIVYGVHGHPVLDRTLRMTPLQLLRHASDDALQETETETGTDDTLTPTPRDNDTNHYSPAVTPINRTSETDQKLHTTVGHCGDVLPVVDNDGHVASAPETSAVTENDLGNPFSGVTMTAHSSMPPILTCLSQSMTSVRGDDDVSRCAMTALSLCQQDDAEIRCHDDSLGQPVSLTQQLLAVDECHSARFALGLYINFNALYTR